MKERVNWDTKHIDYVSTMVSKDEMNKEFTISKKQGYFTNRAGELIITLVENIAISGCFKLPNSKFMITELLIDEVIMYILTNGLRLFNPEKNPNAFSYFSGVVFSKGADFLRARYGSKNTKPRLDLYGQKLTYRGADKKWRVIKLVNQDERIR